MISVINPRTARTLYNKKNTFGVMPVLLWQQRVKPNCTCDLSHRWFLNRGRYNCCLLAVTLQLTHGHAVNFTMMMMMKLTRCWRWWQWDDDDDDYRPVGGTCWVTALCEEESEPWAKTACVQLLAAEQNHWWYCHTDIQKHINTHRHKHRQRKPLIHCHTDTDIQRKSRIVKMTALVISLTVKIRRRYRWLTVVGRMFNRFLFDKVFIRFRCSSNFWYI